MPHPTGLRGTDDDDEHECQPDQQQAQLHGSGNANPSRWLCRRRKPLVGSPVATRRGNDLLPLAEDAFTSVAFEISRVKVEVMDSNRPLPLFCVVLLFFSFNARLVRFRVVSIVFLG